jgi:hypothetical protein
VASRIFSDLLQLTCIAHLSGRFHSVLDPILCTPQVVFVGWLGELGYDDTLSEGSCVGTCRTSISYALNVCSLERYDML